MMKLVKASEPRNYTRPSELFDFLQSFMEQNVRCMEVIGWEKHYKTIHGAVGSYHHKAKVCKFNMKVSIRGDHLYLINLNVPEED